MIKENTMREGQCYLEGLPRIYEYTAHQGHNGDVFLLPRDVDYNYNRDNLIETYGLDEKIEGKPHDLVRIIEVKDALAIRYNATNVLTPLLYAEYLPDILWHLNTQGILFTKVSAKTIEWVKQTDVATEYGKHTFDKFWLPCCGPVDSIQEGDVLCIFNRRVSGWDGSFERPVVELLGAGGHLPTIWDAERACFRALTVEENLAKETQEELGLFIDEKDITIFGGYCNYITHELVILAGIILDESYLPKIQAYAINNNDEDVQGIYMGKFEDVIQYYRKNPEPFAGGAKAAPTNFPNNKELMDRVRAHFQHNG